MTISEIRHLLNVAAFARMRVRLTRILANAATDSELLKRSSKKGGFYELGDFFHFRLNHDQIPNSPLSKAGSPQNR